MSRESEAREVLAPCPFCGGRAQRITLTEADGPGNDGGDVIVCTGVCGASSHVEFGYKENLVSLWNTRAPSTPVQSAAEAVREACAKVAEGATVYDDALQRSAGCKTVGQRIAAAIRAMPLDITKGEDR